MARFAVNAAVLAAVLILSSSVSAKSLIRRSVPSSNVEVTTKAGSSTTPKICQSSNPCGWEIYVPFTKEIVDYMPNTCICATETVCTRDDDDISVSAYVYHCLPKSTNPDVVTRPTFP